MKVGGKVNKNVCGIVGLGLVMLATGFIGGCTTSPRQGAEEVTFVQNGGTIVAGDRVGIAAYQREQEPIVVIQGQSKSVVQQPLPLPPTVNMPEVIVGSDR